MPARASQPRLRLEPMECRLTPALFGAAWPDADNLTMSFAPDGTPVGGGSSSLFSALAGRPNWQLDALRAAQQWAAVADFNLGLVADTGTAFGSPGAVQGDPRRGDIRLAAAPLSAAELATATPFDGLGAGAGEVVLDTATAGSGEDLFTIFLQETGHALGVAGSADANSAMYPAYTGPRTGLGAGDAAAVQAVYGPRPADAFDAGGGNGSTASATPLGAGVAADLTTPGDLDVDRVTVPAGQSTFTAKLFTAGRSLLTADVGVWTAAGVKLAGATAADPGAGDLTVTADNVTAGQTLYVRVAAAGSAFTVGKYTLTAGGPAPARPAAVRDGGTNDTPATATPLAGPTPAAAARWEGVVRADLESPTDRDFYRLRVGDSGAAVVTLTAAAGGTLPALRVLDAAGRVAPAEVLARSAGAVTLQVSEVSGADYRVEVSAPTAAAVGGYVLAADLRAAPVDTTPAAAGRLAGSEYGQAFAFTADGARAYHFGVAVNGADAATAVTLAIHDAAGAAVATTTAATGAAATFTARLPAGDYSVVVVGRNAAGRAVDVNYAVAGLFRDDPIGPIYEDESGGPNRKGPRLRPVSNWRHFTLQTDPGMGM